MYIIYIILILFSFAGIFFKFTVRTNRILILCWFPLFIFLGTFAFFSDDYEVYEELVNKVYIDTYSHFHLEAIWVWFMNLFRGDITLFRLYTFIIISLLLIVILRVSKVNSIVFLSYYTLICLAEHVCWVRQPVVYCIFLLSLILFDKHKLLAILFIIIGCYIHKSSIILLLILPFLFMSINRKEFYKYYVIAFPCLFLLFFALLHWIESFLGIDLEWYLEAENEYASRNIIFSILSVSITCVQFFIFGKTIVLLKNSSEFSEQILIRCLFGVTYLSLFLFLLPVDTNTIFKRLLAFGSIVTVYLWSKNIGRIGISRKYIYIFILLLLEKQVYF